MRSRREFDKSILNALPCHSLLVVARVAVLNMQYLWFSAWIRADQITGAASIKQRPMSSKLWFVCTTRTWLEMTGYTFRCFDDSLYLKVYWNIILPIMLDISVFEHLTIEVKIWKFNIQCEKRDSSVNESKLIKL